MGSHLHCCWSLWKVFGPHGVATNKSMCVDPRSARIVCDPRIFFYPIPTLPLVNIMSFAIRCVNVAKLHNPQESLFQRDIPRIRPADAFLLSIASFYLLESSVSSSQYVVLLLTKLRTDSARGRGSCAAHKHTLLCKKFDYCGKAPHSREYPARSAQFVFQVCD